MFQSCWGESSGVEPGLHIHAETPHAVGLEQATIPGACSGFLERGVNVKKVWGFALLIISHFSETSLELFYFQRIFKKQGLG